jgi:hypothetical protein
VIQASARLQFWQCFWYTTEGYEAEFEVLLFALSVRFDVGLRVGVKKQGVSAEGPTDAGQPPVVRHLKSQLHIQDDM